MTMANESSITQQESGIGRILFTIPDFDEFAELLHDRLHTLLRHLEGISTQFMLITNLFDRDQARIESLKKAGVEDLERLVYSGTDRQRARLESNEPINYLKPLDQYCNRERWREERNANWAALRHQQMTRMEGVETFDFFDAFRKGKSEQSDIKIESLKDYFSGKLNVLKINEKPIIGDYFDLEKDLYIGFPLLGLGKFQGICWVVFKKEEKIRFENKDTITRILKLFELIYTDLAYSWEVSGKASLIGKAIKETSIPNPIYQEVGLNQLYQHSEFYHDNRLEKNDAVLNQIKDQSEKLREQLLRTATITILLDSFAHNISAHSLTALSWWFRERSEYLGEGRAILEALGRDLNPLIRHFKLGQADDLKKLQRPTLSRELYPLFKFLLEKGAFWSGITRQTNFAGKTSDLYNILWFDFINNPLYLGTIANTEEVLKLHIRITVYEKEERVAESDPFRNVKTIKKTEDGTLLDGVFGIINLQDFQMGKNNKTSVFVEKGPLYQALKKELKTIRTFFPGGIIGKHAFFTLLENEIRNVKHFQGETLRSIQKEGLILNISIHERPFDSQNPQRNEHPQLLKFGVWLNHPVNLKSELLTKRIDNLDEDIIMPHTSRPRLGGNFQDKICASMLMTGSFGRVQDKDSKVGSIYYPWIKTAGYLFRGDKDKRLEFEVSHRNYRLLPPEEFNLTFAAEEGEGHLKKYFHLWKGDDILSVNAGENAMNPADMENQARYRFLHLQNATAAQKDQYKSEGIIRVLDSPDKPKDIAEAYHQWLKKWMKVESGNQDMVVDFKEGGTDIGRLTYQNGEIRFENMPQIEVNYENPRVWKSYDNIPQKLQMGIAHGSQLHKHPEKLNYRTDGELIRHFCHGKKLESASMEDKGEMLELLETFAAKICIFDHRAYNRMYMGDAILRTPESSSIEKEKLETQLKRLEVYRNHLRLDIQPEKLDAWKSVQQQGFLNLHFLIVHLSFMESLKDAQGNNYSEERIIEFIDEQILQGRSAESVGDDFVLVITTGRGREQWSEIIRANPKYARFTTFRPIESILSSMEDAMQVADDFNLKYNLTKLLFGS